MRSVIEGRNRLKKDLMVENSRNLRGATDCFSGGFRNGIVPNQDWERLFHVEQFLLWVPSGKCSTWNSLPVSWLSNFPFSHRPPRVSPESGGPQQQPGGPVSGPEIPFQSTEAVTFSIEKPSPMLCIIRYTVCHEVPPPQLGIQSASKGTSWTSRTPSSLKQHNPQKLK